MTALNLLHLRCVVQIALHYKTRLTQSTQTGDIVTVEFPTLPGIEFKYNVKTRVLDFPKDTPRVIRLMADHCANGFWDMLMGCGDMSDEDIQSLGLPDNLVGEIRATLSDIKMEMNKTIDIELENMQRDEMDCMDYIPEHDQTKTKELEAKLTNLANEANKVSKHKFYVD
jgi:hypothetical protein